MMGRSDIKVRVLKEVIADLGQEFATKDVSEDERMIKAHPFDARHSQYHGFVGGAISDYRGSLNVKEIKKGRNADQFGEKFSFVLGFTIWIK